MIHHFWDTFFRIQVVGTDARARLITPQLHIIYSYPSLKTIIYHNTIVVSEDSVSNQ